MNINRHNYESYFLMYADNELNAESRKEVEIFVDSNPDLAGELQSIIQSVLIPDLVSFAGKNTLLKLEAADMELLISSLDKESDDAAALQSLLQNNPVAAREWDLLQKTVLPDEQVSFPHKSLLYRERTGRVTAIRWYRAAAAILLLGGSSLVWYMTNSSNSPQGTVSAPPVKKEINTSVNPNSSGPESSLPEIITDQKQDVTVQTTNTIDINPARLVTNNASTSQKHAVDNSTKSELPDVSKNNLVIGIPEDKKPSHNLPVPALQNINSPERNQIVSTNVLPSNKTNEAGNPVQNVPNNSVAPDSEKNLVKTVAYTEPDQEEPENDNRILFMREEKLKKTKIGGLFARARAKLQNSLGRKGSGIKVANIEITSL